MRKTHGIASFRGFAFAVCALLAGCATVPEPVVEVQAPAPVEVRLPKTVRGSAAPSAPLPAPVVRPASPAGPATSEPPEAIFAPAPVGPIAAPRYPGRQQGVARVLELLPPSLTRDRNGWAADIFAAFVALRLAPTAENFCAAIAVIEQESGFVADPVVPGLSRIAWREIEARRQRFHIPKLALDAALAKPSPDGQTYKRRLDTLRTERQMSLLYDDMIAELPGGRLLLSGYNPVHTGGPMQVSITFAEAHARAAPAYGGGFGKGLRNAVFTRPGGLYFGIAHLLDYPAPYQDPLFRFADFNAGHYSSRNAAFQQAVARLAGVRLVFDGDLLRYENGEPSDEASATQKAVMALSGRLKLGSAEIRAALRQEKRESFARTQLYLRVFAMADKTAGARVPREAMPRIELKSPKIQRKLTTAWFAERVHMRYRACMKRAPVA